ncbi:hypothetical protein NLI96_g12986 [Meripilus lineatus]|uniref:Uncharacterized protein n=1 Tax=Meripilus lineatus TaxID=2056292 RepID=A0AAD5UQ76_9APHY|nr:hypothetical protein NLI96_g12986 [Physisporinus lineatus]
MRRSRTTATSHPTSFDFVVQSPAVLARSRQVDLPEVKDVPLPLARRPRKAKAPSPTPANPPSPTFPGFLPHPEELHPLDQSLGFREQPQSSLRQSQGPSLVVDSQTFRSEDPVSSDDEPEIEFQTALGATKFFSSSPLSPIPTTPSPASSHKSPQEESELGVNPRQLASTLSLLSIHADDDLPPDYETAANSSQQTSRLITPLVETRPFIAPSPLQIFSAEFLSSFTLPTIPRPRTPSQPTPSPTTLVPHIAMATRTTMPTRSQKNAPKFDPEEPRTLNRYFQDLEELFTNCGITGEAEKKKYATTYFISKKVLH